MNEGFCFFQGIQTRGIHVASHLRPVHGRHFLLHHHAVAIDAHDVLVRVLIAVAVLAAGIGAVIGAVGLREDAGIPGDHVGVDLIDVHRAGKVHHVRRVSAGRTHIHLEGHEVADLPETGTCFGEAEEFQMNKASSDPEGFRCPAAKLPELFRGFRAGVVLEIQVLEDNIHDRGPDRHGFKDRIALTVHDGVIGADVAFNKLFHDIGHGGKMRIEIAQLVVIDQLPGIGRPDADVRLDDHGIARPAR